MDKETSDAIQKGLGFLATAGLAAIAGAVQYLQQFRGEAHWSWKIFSIQVLTAVLAGKIAEWLFTAWKSDHNLILAAVALAGWGGAQAIKLAGKKIGTDSDDAAH